MTSSLRKLLDYKIKEPKYVELAFAYADEYADGLFMRGVKYGMAVGIIIALIALVVILNV